MLDHAPSGGQTDNKVHALRVGIEFIDFRLTRSFVDDCTFVKEEKTLCAPCSSKASTIT